jgi:hypothetical protein
MARNFISSSWETSFRFGAGDAQVLVVFVTPLAGARLITIRPVSDAVLPYRCPNPHRQRRQFPPPGHHHMRGKRQQGLQRPFET